MTVNALQVRTALQDHEDLKVRLRALYGDNDEDLILDTLEGQTDLVELIVQMERARQRDERLVQGIKEWAAELSTRQARIQARADKIRDLIMETMERSGRKKIEAPDFTISLRNVPPKVIVSDEDAIPDQYLKVKTTVSPDKAAIKDALDRGEEVPGCSLSNGGQGIAVRKS